MSKNKSYPSRSSCDTVNYCNSVANQYIIMVSIFAAIISQEIENDEELGILGGFLIALGEEVALASEVRIACKAKLENETNIPEETEDIFIRSSTSRNKVKRVRRKRSNNKK